MTAPSKQAALYIRSGPFRWTISISEIISITPTRNPLSGPELSLDRLRIDYDPGTRVMVSPPDRSEFLRQVER